MKEKIAGILGGMGPEATVDMMHRIIRLTPADDDGDHVRVIVDNNPKVPSRIKAIIEHDGSDPGPCLANMAQRLEAWGADFLAIPCNTAHHYFDRVQEAVNIPVIHLIRLVVDQIRETRPEARRIGILASTAVLITGLYEKECQKKGLEVVYPDAGNQEHLFRIIREIKAGKPGPDDRAAFKMVCDHLRDKGADLAVIACTELGVIADGSFPIETLDAAEILAREIVDVAKNRKSLSLLQAPRLG